jgi:TRAP transporter TAXI family solute receptor
MTSPCAIRACTVTLVVLSAALTGCSRAVDEARVTADVKTRLDRDLTPGLFELVSLRREGSSPLPDSESGASRVIVYFNATLKLAQDHAFADWNQLGPSTVAYALGATDKGVFGLKAEGRAGDLVRAYGSTTYEETADGWVPVAATPSETASAPDISGSGPSSRSKQLIDKLAGMVNLPPPGITPQQDEIIAEELARASESIERRVQRRAHTFTVATGPTGTEYARFGASLIEAVNAVAPSVKLRQRASDGSVDNARILARGEADYAIVQGDVAAAALAGDDVFAHGGALTNLRAVGSLFPEAIHVVVRADSSIRTIAELRGKRVNIGAPASGTRFDALAVLEAHGIKPTDLAEARGDGTEAAIARLKQKHLDALFVTTLAPTRPLQQLAAAPGMRLLPIADGAMARLLDVRRGLTAVTLPPNTYPQQAQPVHTVAAAALLVTTADAPDGEVARVADLVFSRMPAQGGRADVAVVSRQNERKGVTIPLHAGAARRTAPVTE